MEKATATHSSTLAWKIPRTEEPGRLQSLGSRRVGHLLIDFTFTFHFHALEKEMATHSSVLAWKIPGTGEPGGPPSMGSHRVRHDWSDLAAVAAAEHMKWRWSPLCHPISAFLVLRGNHSCDSYRLFQSFLLPHCWCFCVFSLYLNNQMIMDIVFHNFSVWLNGISMGIFACQIQNKHHSF